MNRISPNELQRITINGTSLAYYEAGRGMPVVLVHGGVSDVRTWERQIPALREKHRVISYSRRYAHPNEAIPDDADDPMLPHVEDLVALLKALDAAPANLIGHSWGGFICLLAAIRNPGIVRSLVLMEPPVLSLFISTPPRPPELLRVLMTRPRTGLAILKFGAGVIARAQKAFRQGDDEAALRIYGHGVLGEDTFSRLSRSRLEQIRVNLKPDKAQLLGGGFPPLEDDEVRGIRVPILLMHGALSPKLFHYLQDRLEDLLSDVERFEVPGASHIMHEDNPNVVSGKIIDFLARCISRPNSSVP